MEPPPPFDSQPTEVEPPQEDLSLANPFLEKVHPQDRAVVAKYIKEWDGNVTKKFQEYSGKLKPYEALGPIEELQKARQFAQTFRQDPERMFRSMWEAMNEHYGEEFPTHLQRILQIEEEMNDYQEQGVPNEGTQQEDPNQIFQQNVMTELEELRAWREQREASEREAQEMQQLDQVLQKAHTAAGDFDDTWVLQRVAEHGDLGKAIQEWKAMIQKHSQSTSQRQAPKVMGGQGGVPSGQADPTKLRGQDRRAAVQAYLAGIGE